MLAIAAAGVDDRFCLGDLVGYAPWPNETLALLQREDIPIVMGNYDDGTGYDRDECGCAYKDPTEEALGDESFAWTKAHTSDANKAYPRSLKPDIRFEQDRKRFLLVHGSPRKMYEYLFEDKPESTFERIAAGADADVIICGHTHRPYTKQIGETLFVNVGSAGKPKDADPLVDTASGRRARRISTRQVPRREGRAGDCRQRSARRVRRTAARGTRLRAGSGLDREKPVTSSPAPGVYFVPQPQQCCSQQHSSQRRGMLVLLL